MISRHGEARLQQRGFHKFDVDMILFLGDMEHAPGGAVRVKLSQKRIRSLRRSLDRLPKGGTVVIGPSGDVLTAYKGHGN